MRNHDLVSDGFLALTAGGLVLLCSSLVALAFASAPLFLCNTGSTAPQQAQLCRSHSVD